jgi:hypothetical protein
MRRMRSEDGSVALVVGLLLVVFIGIGALVIDVGNLYWERRQLQRGADAAAVAAAQEVVLTGSEADAYAVARTFANENNSRGAHVALSDFEVTSEIVRVTAQTGSFEAPGQLPSFLAGVLGVDEYATSATAAVRLNQIPGGGRTIPIAICVENWSHWTSSGSVLPSGPPAQVISFATAPGAQDPVNAECGNPGSDFGETYPGGFGFLQRDGECMAVTTAMGIFPGSTGNNLVDSTSPCSPQQLVDFLIDIVDDDREVLIPIFDGYQSQGSDGKFEVIGYGGFKLEGFKFLSSGGGISPDREHVPFAVDVR